MRILIVGGGGREHALVWKLSRTKRVRKIYAAPGNPGIAEIATCVNILASDIAGLLRFAEEKNIDFTVIGPELPLAMGIVDEFERAGLKVFGPNRHASRIEADKSFAREFTDKFGIPAPRFQIYETAAEAMKYLKTVNEFPVVVKAAGLAAGKGVFTASNRREYEKIVDQLLVQHKLGEAASRIVVEEFLTGQEASVLVITDGLSVNYLPSAQDHKKLYDRNRGPNTGGMGAYAPYPVNKRVANIIENVIIQPTVLAMRDQGLDYRGVLYAGLILTSTGPKVLEFNCRFGDPEAQVILPLVEGDLLGAMVAAAERKLSTEPLRVKNSWALGVVLASAGYPNDYRVGEPIEFKQKLDPGMLLFHAGTKMDGQQLVTASGRVLNLVAVHENLKIAKQRVYEAIKKIHFRGMYFRKDIGNTGMKKMKRRRRK